MVEIEFSFVSLQPILGQFQQALKEFEEQTRIKVNLRPLTWDQAWSELIRVAIYRHGPDISEIGNTWTGDLAGMNVLHPFSKTEIAATGGPEVFLKPSWEGGMLVGAQQVWTIPWLADARLLFYRRDLLDKIGVDEATAFKTPENLQNTLQHLKDAGVTHPWVVPTRKTSMTIHCAASWVWGAGGQFVSEDGKHALFHEPNACAGFRQYFELGQFLAPDARELDDIRSDALFGNGQVAVTVSGPWLFRQGVATPGVRSRTGVTIPPGVPYVGGSNLVIWQHTNQLKEALMLVNFLTSRRFQSTYLQNAGLLPVRTDVFTEPSFSADPITQTLSRELQIGSSFRLIPLWGLVEERLSDALSQIWTEVLGHPNTDLREIVDPTLVSLARKLDLVLSDR